MLAVGFVTSVDFHKVSRVIGSECAAFPPRTLEQFSL